MTYKQIIDEEICKLCGARECEYAKCKIASRFEAKEQKLKKIKKYVEDNEWCILDDTYKELIQIIEDKQNDR